MSIDFTPGMINTYHGDIYNRTTDTDNVKTPDTPMWPCDNQEEQQPINFSLSEEGYNAEQFDLAQQQLQQINACHTNTTYTNADYSKVVAQLVSLITNIETISSTPLTQQTQSILNQINNNQFMQRRQGQWLPVSATRLSAQVTVPKQVQMLLQPGSDIWQKEYALELQRRRLTLHDIELELQKEAKKKTPQIRFSPFEPATPFTLRFYSAAQNACWAVKLAHDGALSLNQCDERMR